jgi:hypothetical protein
MRRWPDLREPGLQRFEENQNLLVFHETASARLSLLSSDRFPAAARPNSSRELNPHDAQSQLGGSASIRPPSSHEDIMPYEITHINYDLHSGRMSLVLSEHEPRWTNVQISAPFVLEGFLTEAHLKEKAKEAAKRVLEEALRAL